VGIEKPNRKAETAWREFMGKPRRPIPKNPGGKEEAGTPKASEVPDLTKDAHAWASRKFGERVAYALLVCIVMCSAIWGGFKDEIKKSEIWPNVVEKFTTIPKAKPDEYSVVLGKR
jgi:hypothetical protein